MLTSVCSEQCISVCSLRISVTSDLGSGELKGHLVTSVVEVAVAEPEVMVAKLVSDENEVTLQVSVTTSELELVCEDVVLTIPDTSPFMTICVSPFS